MYKPQYYPGNREEKGGEIEPEYEPEEIDIKEFFEVNPVLLKSAAAEDDTIFSSLLDTDEYQLLQELCEENLTKKVNPYNIALIGNYGTGKSKIALNLLKKFEKKGGVGFYIEVSGLTAGQIITNIYRDVHKKLFGLRRLIYQSAPGAVSERVAGIARTLGISKPMAKVETPELSYVIPDEHIEHIRSILGLRNREEEKIARYISEEIHSNFMEAFAGIADFSEKLKGRIEIDLPEEKVASLTSSEKAAEHLGEILDILDKPVLFILDELEKIYKLEPPERVKFLDFMRAFMDGNKKSVFIFCFTRFSFDSLIKQHAALYSRIPRIISLKNFNRVQFNQFIDNRFKQGLKEGHSLNDIFENSFFEFLWELTAGNQRSSLFILDRFLEYSSLNKYNPLYDQGDLITFLELQPDIKDQLFDMLLYDVKERAQMDPKMSLILDILAKNYGGGPTTFAELSSNERCVYDQGTLMKVIIKMLDKDIIKASKINKDLHLIVNIDIPSILSKTTWFDKKREVFE